MTNDELHAELERRIEAMLLLRVKMDEELAHSRKLLAKLEQGQPSGPCLLNVRGILEKRS